MNVLVVFGAERDGAEEVARCVAATARRAGHRADVSPARHALDVDGYDAVVVGGALEGGAWHHDARQFVLRHTMALRDRRVWFFSCASPPAGARAAALDAAPTPEVRELMDFVCARGHATFGAPALAPGVAALLADRAARRRIERWAGELDLEPDEGPAGRGWRRRVGRLWAALLRAARPSPPGVPGPTLGP